MHILGFLARTVTPLQAHCPDGPYLHGLRDAHLGGHTSGHGGGHGGAHTGLQGCGAQGGGHAG
jgi:hypothetical protein